MRTRGLQTLLSPKPLHLIVVHFPALSPEQAVGHPPAPADVLSGDVAETMPELCLLQACDIATMGVGAAVLTHHPSYPPLGCPVHSISFSPLSQER
jgi:hypothetical protein